MSGADYLPPDAMTLQAAGDALSARLSVIARGHSESDRTYYDTFDGLLQAEGLSVVHEDGQLSLVERATGVEHATITIPQPTQPLLPMRLGPSAFRDALLPVVEVRALLPLVHVHSRQRAIDVLDEERKTVVRMTLEQSTVIISALNHRPLRPRVRLAAVRGYDDHLAALRDTLRHELGFKPADQPLVDEAVRAGGGVPGGTPSKISVPLARGQRADAATVAILRALLHVIDANVAGTIADIDAEFLHDFRVAVRRSRAVQRELGGVFPPEPLAAFRTDFKWLQTISGDSRDLDVYVLDFDDMRAMVPEPMRAELEPLRGVLEGRRLVARREMARALRSERAARILADWGAFLEDLVELDTEDRPDAARPVGEVAGQRIERVFRRMVKMGRAITSESPAEDYHELRKKGKELRYLLELYGTPLFEADVVKPMVKTLKGLQDVLGRHQDREVQMAMLHSLRDEVSARPGGPAALMAMGALVQRLGEDEQTARGEFADSFAAFASKSQRRLVKETFV
jgi:CHAD domain-containing protein